MKSYTDIEQSKKLAEILPLESADMHLTNSSIKGEMYVDEFKPVLVPYLRAKDSLDAYSKIVNNMIAWEVIPCWSLAALLKYLSEIKPLVYTPILFPSEGKWILQFAEYGHGNVCEVSHDNPIDACNEMILLLHTKHLL
jgi:hypothetical protein